MRAPSRQVLVVEDEPSHALLIASSLEPLADEIVHVETGAEAISTVAWRRFDLVLLDVGLPDMSGLEVHRGIGGFPDPPPVIFVTVDDRVDDAVEALRNGAANYVVKRANYLETVARAAAEVLARGGAPRRRPACAEGASSLVGTSSGIEHVRRLIAEYGPVEAPVLVLGETGTGKELVARELHAASARAGGPFVAVNCAAIPEALLESEFFGVRRGAFTGAEHDRPGLVAAAEGGTLFLDEIGDVPASLQAKLLRVLESRTYRALGATGERRSDVRIVAATHADLPSLVRDGRFREDLYYRLDVLRIELPPLRDRPSDVALLVQHFARRYAPGAELHFTSGALAELLVARWPGNVRELEHVVHRTLVHWRGGPIERFLLSPHVAQAPAAAVERPGREALEQLLLRHGGRLAPVAAALGVSVRTVQRRLRRLGLHGPAFRRQAARRDSERDGG